MAQTSTHGIQYPEPSDTINFSGDLQSMAESTDAAITANGVGGGNSDVVWLGTGGVGTWPDRPTSDPDVRVTWNSVNDANAPAPPALLWDSWMRAPGATF